MRDSSLKGRRVELDSAYSTACSTATYRNHRRFTWQFGHRRKLKQATLEFAKYSSLHGVHYICPGGAKISWVKRVFYCLLFVGCTASMLASVVFLVQESFSTESVYISSTSKDAAGGREEDPLFPAYPRITLCRRPGYVISDNEKDRDLVEYAFLALGFPFPPLTPEERTLLIGLEMAKAINNSTAGGGVGGLKVDQADVNQADVEAMVAFAGRMEQLKTDYENMKLSQGKNFSLMQFVLDKSVSCERIFVRCIVLVFAVSCCDVFRPVLTTNGYCHSMVMGEILDRIDATGNDAQLSFTFDLKEAPKHDKAVDIGYEIHVSDPRNKEVMFQREGHSIMNGFTTVLKSKLTKTSREALYTPWHGMSNYCPSLPPWLDLMGYKDRYFKSACEQRYLDTMMRNNCHCRLLTDRSNSSLRHCDPEDSYGCFFRVVFHDNRKLTEISRLCAHPCLEYHYESEASFVKIGRENISRLIYLYNNQQYSLYEYRTATISSLMSQIGGALGLYLGASIITAVELVTFFLLWIWYKFVPHRRVQTSDSSAILRRKAKSNGSYFY